MAQSSETVEPQVDSRAEVFRDTKLIFYYADALVVAELNNAVWSLSTTECYKLSLNPGDLAAIVRRSVVGKSSFFFEADYRQDKHSF